MRIGGLTSKEPCMTCDVAFRFQQALDPSALTTVQACLHALRAAIKDCRNAGHSGEADPAILLLARHLGAVACATGGEDGQLRRACMERVSDLRGKPALVALAHKASPMTRSRNSSSIPTRARRCGVSPTHWASPRTVMTSARTGAASRSAVKSRCTARRSMCRLASAAWGRAGKSCSAALPDAATIAVIATIGEQSGNS